MSIYLVVQATYEKLEYALFDDEQCIAFFIGDKRETSSLFIPLLSELLQNNNCKLFDLDFIALNIGPGPLSTLRILVATINGLGFATGIPLVGVNCLAALLHEYNTDAPVSIAILNAYSNDLFFAIREHGTLHYGCENVITFLDEVRVRFGKQRIDFIGNATEAFEDVIIQTLPNACINKEHDFPQLKTIAQVARQLFNEGNTKTQLVPLYLKALKYQKLVH